VLDFEPMTYGSESECATHYTIAPEIKWLMRIKYGTMRTDFNKSFQLFCSTIVEQFPDSLRIYVGWE